MASLSLHPQSGLNLDGIKVKPHMVRHRLRNHPLILPKLPYIRILWERQKSVVLRIDSWIAKFYGKNSNTAALKIGKKFYPF